MPGLTNSFQAALSESMADLSGLSFDDKPNQTSNRASSSSVKEAEPQKSPAAFSLAPKPFPTTTSETTPFTFGNHTPSSTTPTPSFGTAASKHQHTSPSAQEQPPVAAPAAVSLAYGSHSSPRSKQPLDTSSGRASEPVKTPSFKFKKTKEQVGQETWIHQSLSAMSKYQSLSHEEMRLKAEHPSVASQAQNMGAAAPNQVPFTSASKASPTPHSSAPSMASFTTVAFSSEATPAPRPKEPSTKPRPSRQAHASNDDAELAQYVTTLRLNGKQTTAAATIWPEEIKMTPLFTWPAKEAAAKLSKVNFEQYAVLGHELPSADRPSGSTHTPIFLNTNTPWSTFICGSQGSGKSYTMSCMLENCLLSSSAIGRCPKPLAGMLFHYDAHNTGAVCEAAYLATQMPVRVLVSPSNFFKLKALYENLPGLQGKIKVVPLLLKESQLNTERMLRLMAFSDKDGAVPLYMEVIIQILRQMAMESAGRPGLNFAEFKARLETEEFAKMQQGPMKLRLSLLEGFLDFGYFAQRLRVKGEGLVPQPGALTIVDLSDPFVDPASACVLFDICLALFLEDRSGVGKVIALDEAHQFMNETAASEVFTQSLLTVIREQRHKGARVIIATQEPTISPILLDLCSMTFVHRFTLPEWLETLKKHLAAASSSAGNNKQDVEALFREIVQLNVGESLLFSPTAMLDLAKGEDGTPGVIEKLGLAKVHFKTRPRLTLDGGRSVEAVVGGGESEDDSESYGSGGSGGSESESDL